MAISHDPTGITSPNDPTKQVSRDRYLADHVIDDGTITESALAADVQAKLNAVSGGGSGLTDLDGGDANTVYGGIDPFDAGGA
jgi:hypothetical protein